jgi:DNA-binding transcriptional MerR regulator
MKRRYPIRVVSRLTGVAIDTLRAWERRHGVVAPTRANETRMYTDADVARLRLLHEAVQSGHRIGRIGRMSDAELQRLAQGPDRAPSPARAVPAARQGPINASGLERALASLDTGALDREISQLAIALPPSELVRDVVLPALRDAGERWHRRRGGIALEHLLSSTLRSLLGSFLRLYAPASAGPRLLFTTLEGDRHEIGILCAAMLAASSGLAVSYLGPDLPAPEIVEAVKSAGASVLVLGLTFSVAATDAGLRAITRRLPAKVGIWSGGRRAAAHASALGKRGLVVADFDDYTTELARIGGRGR